MKAIETTWKGYRFRSRTEARWAVFLDRLGVEFDYEPEGVILPSGPYLPDFRLRSFPSGTHFASDEKECVWLEVKGGEPTELEQERCSELAAATGEPVLLAVGAPDWAPQILLFDPVVEDNMRPVFAAVLDYLTIIDAAELDTEGEAGAALVIARPGREKEYTDDAEFDAVWNSLSKPFAKVLGVPRGNLWGPSYRPLLSARVRAAYDAARAARFEFGQSDQRWPKP